MRSPREARPKALPALYRIVYPDGFSWRVDTYETRAEAASHLVNRIKGCRIVKYVPAPTRRAKGAKRNG